jgi:hypothetical protein
LTRSEAVTLLIRLQDLADLEREVVDVQRIHEKLRRLMGLGVVR